MKTFCLSVHAPYACRHTGACCSRWEVPADPHVVALVRRHGLWPSPNESFLSDTGTQTRLAHRPDGGCVFRRANRCSIHQTAGEMGLPTACRHYPRVILRDGRGTLVSLSHYCPTAASLLFSERRLRRVDASATLQVREPMEGLDARDALPPLLRPGMLADLAGYDAWEGAVIDVLSRAASVEQALAVIEAATEDIRGWTPARGPLQAAVAVAFDRTSRELRTDCRAHEELELLRSLEGSELLPDAGTDRPTTPIASLPPSRTDLHAATASYIAARAFGNWVAYQGQGLRTVVAWLRACHDALRLNTVEVSRGCPPTRETLIEAIRQTDLLMLHSIDSHAFAREAVVFERRPAA